MSPGVNPEGVKVVNPTVPVNPFTADTVRTDVAEVPVTMVREEGLADIVNDDTLIVTVTK